MNEITRISDQEMLTLLGDLIRLGKKAEARLDSVLGGTDLSATKLLLLDRMGNMDEPLSLSSLATHLVCVKSNVTQLVDNLEGSGLVKRVADPQDRRSTLLEITDKGKRQYDAALDALQPVVEKLESLSPEDRAALQTLAQTISKLLT